MLVQTLANNRCRANEEAILRLFRSLVFGDTLEFVSPSSEEALDGDCLEASESVGSRGSALAANRIVWLVVLSLSLLKNKPQGEGGGGGGGKHGLRENINFALLFKCRQK